MQKHQKSKIGFIDQRNCLPSNWQIVSYNSLKNKYQKKQFNWSKNIKVSTTESNSLQIKNRPINFTTTSF